MPRLLPPTLLRIAACLTLAGLGATSATAGIASVTGAITEISHPTGTLVNDTVSSDTSMYVWFESFIEAPGQQNLEHVGAGLVNSGASANPGSVTPGVAESYIVHFDQAANSGTIDLSATITFDEAIIGIWYSTGGLTGSDTQWKPSNLTYSPSLSFRQFEVGSDQFRISNDLRTLTIVNIRTINSGIDQIRVLVNPEPSTFAFMGLGLVGLATLVRRRRRRRGSAAERLAQ